MNFNLFFYTRCLIRVGLLFVGRVAVLCGVLKRITKAV